MSVLPVSNVSLKSNYSFLNFGQNESSEHLKKSPKVLNTLGSAKTVPVVVLMAMSPSMLNGAAEKFKEQDLINNKDITEVITQTPTKEYDTSKTYVIKPEIIQTKDIQGDPPFGWEYLDLSKERIHFSKSALGNGEKYHLVFARGVYDKGEKDVSVAYFVKDGTSCSSSYLAPPIIRELIYHDLGKKDEFCGIKVVYPIPDSKNYESIGYETRELRIDDATAQILIDLLARKGEFNNRSGIKFYQTTSPDILPPDPKYY